MRECNVEICTWTLFSHAEGRKQNAVYFVADWIKLIFWIKRIKPDVLLAYRTTSYGFLAFLSGFRPYVIAAQGHNEARANKHYIRFLKEKLLALVIKKSAFIHVWSESMSVSMLKLGASPSKLLIRPRGINLLDFPFVSKDWDAPHYQVVVTRSLYKEYHIDEIIRAISIVNAMPELNGKVLLNIVGEGPERTYLEKLGKELVDENLIKFHGKVANEELSIILRESHIYCSTPDTEGASASLFEAFASGLYPIVSDLPGNRVWINEGNGRLVPYDNPEILAKVIAEVIQSGADNKGVLDMNRSIAENKCDLFKNVSYFISRYSEVI